jgi:hypothetical protein
VSKQKDVTTLLKKEKAWLEVSDKYNSAANISKRDVSALKTCLLNLQAKAKKEASARKVECRKTGGGPAPPEMSATTSAVIDLMPQVFHSLEVDDDDASSNSGKLLYTAP